MEGRETQHIHAGNGAPTDHRGAAQLRLDRDEAHATLRSQLSPAAPRLAAARAQPEGEQPHSEDVDGSSNGTFLLSEHTHLVMPVPRMGAVEAQMEQPAPCVFAPNRDR